MKINTMLHNASESADAANRLLKRAALHRVSSSILGFLVLLVAGLLGASPALHVTRLNPSAAAPATKPLKVYQLADRVDRPYEIVGVVSTTGNRGNVRTKGRAQMLAEAAAMGAEALVGYYYDDEKTASTDAWAGALAVRFLSPGSAPPLPSKAVVVIPHAAIGEDFGTGKKAQNADAIARKLARFLLAKKGYYAVFADEMLNSEFPDDLKKLDASRRLQFGNPDADFILALSLGRRHAVNILVIAGASQAVGTALYSKTANAVTWQNKATGSGGDLGAGFGLGHLFVPSAKTIQSTRAALEKAFENLPNLASPLTTH